jgi:hypothetical protein
MARWIGAVWLSMQATYLYISLEAPFLSRSHVHTSLLHLRAHILPCKFAYRQRLQLHAHHYIAVIGRQLDEQVLAVCLLATRDDNEV